ncbi:TOM70 [Acanthosepion pharaonis]|uniref:TOM70 n=1 Tax=Acanthosepion pharaonis TaxID=158019 RepID=A0A812EWS9_ACAPH|nr:TOM70 [Sepia pharaonis]
MAMDKLSMRMERLREMVQGQLEGLSKWQLALLFGTPVTLGLVGFIYYKSKKHKKKSDCKGNSAAGARSKEREAEPPLIDQAVETKKRGNTLFKAGKYTEAIDCYTGAIALCPLDRPDQLATFYQNRAAAYDQLNNHKQVVSDCSRALRLNPKYAKALSRRAKSADQLGDLKLAIEDLTFLCMLENFANEETVKFSERNAPKFFLSPSLTFFLSPSLTFFLSPSLTFFLSLSNFFSSPSFFPLSLSNFFPLSLSNFFPLSLSNFFPLSLSNFFPLSLSNFFLSLSFFSPSLTFFSPSLTFFPSPL